MNGKRYFSYWDEINEKKWIAALIPRKNECSKCDKLLSSYEGGTYWHDIGVTPWGHQYKILRKICDECLIIHGHPCAITTK